MYVQIENPFTKGEFETWSCSTTYEMKDTVYVGEVFNYNYGETRLNNDAVERDTANVFDQTRGHSEYTRNGPWMAADALKWYTQEYSIERNYASATCTAVRLYGEGQKGFFDLPVGDTVTVNMGYRVYEDASKTRARIHRDYENIQFDLLGEKLESGASYSMSIAGFALAALAMSLAF